MNSVDLVFTLSDERLVRLQASHLRPFENAEENSAFDADMRILMNGVVAVDGWVSLSAGSGSRFGVPLAENGKAVLCVSHNIEAFCRSLPDGDAATVEQGMIDVLADLEFEQGD